MRSEVYYFSGTGNTLYVAKKIGEKLDCDIKGIHSYINESSVETDAEKIIVAFPVYAWGPPVAVMNFVDKIKDVEKKDIYCVMTYGGSPGGAAHIFRKRLQKAGGKLTAALGLRMPDNCITLFDVPKEEKRNKILDESHEKIDEIANYIAEGKSGDIKSSGFIVDLVSGPAYKSFLFGLPKMDKNFYSTEKCTKCGLCKDICPVKNIELVDGKPVWQGKCEQCMACIQWCPVQAIQYKKKTVKRGRYHHPDIKVNEMKIKEN